MVNPSNFLHCAGEVQNVNFIRSKMGEEFACEFKLKVKRNYLNKGQQLYDYPTIRCEGKDRVEFMHRVGNGSVISIVGSFQTMTFQYNGKNYDRSIILVESLEKIGKTSGNCNNDVLEQGQVPLPFS